MMTLSIDWEDFGQLYAWYHHHMITEPARGSIERQTDVILDMLDLSGAKATFFVLGMLAKYRPVLVKKIASRGHEIAMHGQGHLNMLSLSPDTARKDLEDAYKTISDIAQTRIHGYRAPFFSINRANLYVLEILSDLGLTYDSSIFPVKLPRYGIAGFDPRDALYKLPNGKQIVELPLTVSEYLGRKWPVAGGGYIRLMPEILINKIFNTLYNKQIDSMIYMHPYEFDPLPIDVSANYPSGASGMNQKTRLLNFRWNLFRTSVRPKIAHLLSRYKFNTCLERAEYVKNNANSSELLAR